MARIPRGVNLGDGSRYQATIAIVERLLKPDGGWIDDPQAKRRIKFLPLYGRLEATLAHAVRPQLHISILQTSAADDSPARPRRDKFHIYTGAPSGEASAIPPVGPVHNRFQLCPRRPFELLQHVPRVVGEFRQTPSRVPA